MRTTEDASAAGPTGTRSALAAEGASDAAPLEAVSTRTRILDVALDLFVEKGFDEPRCGRSPKSWA